MPEDTKNHQLINPFHNPGGTVMKSFLVLTLMVLVLTGLPAPVTPKNQDSPAEGERTAIDLTIYNQNLSLIREVRNIRIPRGMSSLVLPDIPATIDGTSLHFVSLTDPSSVRVLEQNYQYDLVHPAKILEKYLGKDIQFVRVDPETKKEFTVTGKLLSTGYTSQQQYGTSVRSYVGTGGMIAEINGKIEINPAGRLLLPGLPEGLILKPQLEWLVSSTRGGMHSAEVSYMAGQISWICNYVALLDSTDKRLDLTGWVTVSNNSGTNFADAHLKLVAGDVNVVQHAMKGALRANAEMAADAAAPQFTQTELFEYKLYSLQRRTTIRNNETKQIELVSGRGVPSRKVFIYDGLGDQWRYWYNNYSYRSQSSFGQQSNPKVGVFVLFKNENDGGLGIPLPKGKVRVYKRDDEGKEQFVGEDEIDHTPKDEEVRLYLGNAFDIVGERVQKDFKSFAGGRIVEETIAVTLRNHKKESVDVLVYEHPWRWSQWEILGASNRWEKVDQTTVKIPVRLARDQEKTVTYTIRYSW
jgi:hypothetical protein